MSGIEKEVDLFINRLSDLVKYVVLFTRSDSNNVYHQACIKYYNTILVPVNENLSSDSSQETDKARLKICSDIMCNFNRQIRHNDGIEDDDKELGFNLMLKNNNTFIDNVPYLFIIDNVDSDYHEFIWEYIRVLYYTSELIYFNSSSKYATNLTTKKFLKEGKPIVDLTQHMKQLRNEYVDKITFAIDSMTNERNSYDLQNVMKEDVYTKQYLNKSKNSNDANSMFQKIITMFREKSPNDEGFAKMVNIVQEEMNNKDIDMDNIQNIDGFMSLIGNLNGIVTKIKDNVDTGNLNINMSETIKTSSSIIDDVINEYKGELPPLVETLVQTIKKIGINDDNVTQNNITPSSIIDIVENDSFFKENKGANFIMKSLFNSLPNFDKFN